jgi:hypothetical protein
VAAESMALKNGKDEEHSEEEESSKNIEDERFKK